jgi:hypothetical protein
MTSVERKEIRYQRRIEVRKEKKQNFYKNYDDFSLIINANNLYAAYRKSKRNVAWKESVQRYSALWIVHIMDAIKRLTAGENMSKGFVEFDLYERGKRRHIRSIHISERVIQKCLCDQVLVPVLSRSLIYDNGASLKDKGVHFSIKRLITHLTKFYRWNGFSNKGFALSIDFSKFFDSIRHDILLNEISKYIKDPKLFNLIKDFITIFGDNISLGLGSQISQICAVSYPNKVDHVAKEELGIRCYGRYMDDIYLIHESKEYLRYCLKRIIEVCDELGIKINLKKTRLVSLDHGIIFLKGKYSLNEKGKVIRRPCRMSTERMRRKLNKFKKLMADGRMGYDDIYRSYQSWHNTFKKRFNAYYRILKMDNLYKRLFITGE